VAKGHGAFRPCDQPTAAGERLIATGPNRGAADRLPRHAGKGAAVTTAPSPSGHRLQQRNGTSDAEAQLAPRTEKL